MSRLKISETVKIEYEDSGGEGPVLMFGHGFLMNKRMFDLQVNYFSAFARCITWDQRSHGSSSATEEYTLWDSARDQLALMDHLELDSAIVCGMSQGGLVGLRAALLAPERVAGLVMIDSQAGKLSDASAAKFRQMADGWDDPATRQASLDWIASLIIGENVEADYWKRLWDQLEVEDFRRGIEALASREDLTMSLANITAPVLVIHGENDAATTQAAAVEVAEGVPDCRGFVTIPDAPHASNMTHPEIVNTAIVSFLEDINNFRAAARR